jgi:hypothetical protein
LYKKQEMRICKNNILDVRIKHQNTIMKEVCFKVYFTSVPLSAGLHPQSTQSAGPVLFLIFFTISIFLLASLVTGRRRQCNPGAE